jgi:hypothetical protein
MNLGELVDACRPPVDRGSSLVQHMPQPRSWGYYAVRAHTLGEIAHHGPEWTEEPVFKSPLPVERSVVEEKREPFNPASLRPPERPRLKPQKRPVYSSAYPQVWAPVALYEAPDAVDCLVETCDGRLMIFRISAALARAQLAYPTPEDHGFTVLAMDVKKQ